MDEMSPTDMTHHPLMIELEPGRYHWCTCGGSANMPWCDGSHAGTQYIPVTFDVAEKSTHAICNCQITNTPPFCDNSHATAED